MMATHPPHPAGMQHPGMPYGQPMGPGQGPNPGQPIGQPMQMHPGVSGPNGPHVTQAGPMMAGMPPGVGGTGPGGPSAHAMSHLAPQHFLQQHQMQQALANNPALAMHQQHQQRQLMAQRQAAMLQQQQNGMAMRFPNGANPAFAAQQMAAMQASNPQQFSSVQLTPHLQQLQHQQHMMSQQQAQAQAQAQQQAQQNNMAAHLAMQHGPSQSSNPGQQNSQNQQGQQAGGQQGQMQPRPQMRQGTADPQASPAQPPSAQQAQQSAQPQGPQGQQQQPQQSQPNAAQQQQQQQAQQQHQQSQQQAQQQRQQQVLAHQAAMMRHQQAQNKMTGALILRLMSFSDHLSRFTAKQDGANNMAYWQNFVNNFFAEDSVFKLTVRDSTEKAKPKQFTVCYASLARYYTTHFESGVDNIQLTMDGATEVEIGSNGHLVQIDRAKFIYWFKDGMQLVCSGKLQVIFEHHMINSLEFVTLEHKQYISWPQIKELFEKESPSQIKSPRMNRAAGNKQRAQQRQQQEEPDPTIALSDVPKAPIGDWGVTHQVFAFLEIGETMNQLQDLISHSISHPEMTPAEAMDHLVAQYNVASSQQAQLNPQFQQAQQQQQQSQQPMQHPQLNLPPNGLPQHTLPSGARTPSATQGPPPGPMGGPQQMQTQFMSPAMQNLNLPFNPANPMNGSPHLQGGAGMQHTPSPAQTHMQAPGMVPQRSQPGTNVGAGVGVGAGVNGGSNQASANTSPNATNKRRRASVKVEGGDEGGGGGGGAGQAKVKQSPRVGGNKRIKGQG